MKIIHYGIGGTCACFSFCLTIAGSVGFIIQSVRSCPGKGTICVGISACPCAYDISRGWNIWLIVITAAEEENGG